MTIDDGMTVGVGGPSAALAMAGTARFHRDGERRRTDRDADSAEEVRGGNGSALSPRFRSDIRPGGESVNGPGDFHPLCLLMDAPLGGT
ncbi:hypothetical protein [Stackebrandtia soli]|uniref:hypothetical protein n=1 Tax=Stackebrandtia soli TaxID=1892856 RepID=UPI0039EAA00B